ncbi:hypothetical protein FR943_03255 [Mycobacterium sp. TNTM28]|uniref:DUF732 domain-containing protein n=1 Tax=[Mycobacterium] fortunisiensis TaxID=2600579 RepID=A0ABS6KH30_9MYCO|nr:DUF3558 domain-containing protein [[Mycobacterium] fortunisiensis]MBU9762874.1 hypothetical protein [[Mycobacterium] fortunisiensis]
MYRWAVAAMLGLGIALGVGLTGCSTTTAGTPMADPDQTGLSTTTTKRTPSWTTEPSRPSLPGPRTGGVAATPPPNGMSTTCREYVGLDESTQLGMVELLGENGYAGMKRNPFLWISYIRVKCVLADRDATVVEAINEKTPGG